MLTIDWSTFIITVPQSFLTFVSGTFYTCDTNALRLAQKQIEASEDGIVFGDITLHNTQVTIGNDTFARTIGQLPPYTLQFENGLYSVQLQGSNNNYWVIPTVLVQNTVQVIPTNSAGLIVGSGSGSGGDAPTSTQNAQAVWEYPITNLSGNKDTLGYWVSRKLMTLAKYLASNKNHD